MSDDTPESSKFGRSWLGFGVVVACTSLGLVLLAHADGLSRQGYAYSAASPFFWSGLLLIFVPAAYYGLRRTTGRGERLAIVVVLGVALYLVKVLAFPDGFAIYDEYIHWRNTLNLLQTQRVFGYNPLLPTAAYYPGLSAITAGVVDLTGLSVFTSGLIVVGLARLLISASVFLIIDKITKSSRAAVVGSLIYAANPMFLFWSSSFAYEDLALPLAAFAVWWIAKMAKTGSRLTPIFAVISIAAVIVSHHVVSLGLAALLSIWWLVERLIKNSDVKKRSLGVIAIFAVSASLVWLFIVAEPAAHYLFSNNIYPALQQTGGLVFGHSPSRRLYVSGGYVSPKWETMAGFAAVGVLVLLLPPGLYAAWRYAVPKRGSVTGERRAIRVTVLMAAVVAACYPVSLIPRLTTAGIAISGRSSEYIFTALGCILGLLVEQWYQRGKAQSGSVGNEASDWVKTVVVVIIATIVFAGNVTVGTAFYQRLPESSSPEGYPWTVQPDVIAASVWAREHLGVNQRFGANAEDALALATYGEQDTLAENSVWPIFFARTLSTAVVHSIESEKLHYVLVDWRMTAGVPPSPGYYFSPQEPDARGYTDPFPSVALQKFDTSCTRLLYRVGSVQIYDLSRIESGSCVPESTASPRRSVS